MAHCELEEHVPVKLTTSHPVVEEGGDTVWNVGTSVDEKGGYSYSVIKFHKDRPGVTGTMMIEDAQVRVFSQRLHFFWKSVSVRVSHVFGTLTRV